MLDGQTPETLCLMAFGMAVIEDPTLLFQAPEVVEKQLHNCEQNLENLGVPETGIVLPDFNHN